ncbi:MAG: beta-ketoacyl synthase N-terminal-like domain-containing protein, partial [Pseudomonadota bacterium]
MSHRTPAPILGLSVILPGAPDAESFWRNLEAGRLSIGEIGPERFSAQRYWHPQPGQRGKTYSVAAGLTEDPWALDPGFFGLSPREAEQMDPQQRLLLRASWAALEDAQAPIRDIDPARIGVFVGGSSMDFANSAALDPFFADAHFMTGSTLSILSNRLSSVFGFTGPSLTVDTACSSSLHALAFGLEALWEERLDLALVAGVNLLTSPFPFIGFSQARMLSPSGRCRPFAEGADGYVRGEGAAAVLLARPGLFEDRRRGAVRAIALSSDGRKTGISVPSAAGQQAVLRRALDEAGLEAEDLAFVEAHGTGTAVGDPIEAAALGAVLGAARSEPLPIGSVKANIGHLEPASGLAGFAKALLSLENGVLPQSLGAEALNPSIDFERLNLSVAQERRGLPAAARYAGVNSFGFGGTNAHVVLEAAPSCAPDAAQGAAQEKTHETMQEMAMARPAPLILSAQTEAGLRSLAARCADLLESEGAAAEERASGDDAAPLLTAPLLPSAPLIAALAHRRAPMSRRLVLAPAPDRAALGTRLRAAARGEAQKSDHGAAESDAPLFRDQRPLAFVFSGNGSQWAGMGRAALSADPGFATRLSEIDEALAPRLGWSATEALGWPDLTAQLRLTSVAQPLLFALQAAMADRLIDRGLRPSLCFGHSVGEIAAAYCARALSLTEAAMLVVARSELQEAAREAGAMAVLALGAEEAQEALAMLEAEGAPALDIAGINSARNVTIAGPVSGVDALERLAKARRWRMKRLDLDYPFHSRLLDPIKRRFLRSVTLRPANASTPRAFISSVTGRAEAPEALDEAYWWRNLRDPVRFLDAAATAVALGAEVMLEIGPRPVLQSYLRDAAQPAEGAPAALSGARAVLASAPGPGGEAADAARAADAEPARDELWGAFANALAAGAAHDREAVFGADPSGRRRLVDRPCLDAETAETRPPAPLPALSAAHPLLGWPTAPGAGVFEADLDPLTHPFLADHKVDGAIVFPAAGYIEIALAAARETMRPDAVDAAKADDSKAAHAPETTLAELRDFQIFAALTLEPGAPQRLRTSLSQDRRIVTIQARPLGAEDEPWRLYARGRLTPATPIRSLDGAARAQSAAPLRRWSKAEIYAFARKRALDYGPRFALSEGLDKESRSLYRAALNTQAAPRGGELAPRGAPLSAMICHPSLLDAALHGLFAGLDDPDWESHPWRPYLPVSVERAAMAAPTDRTAAEALIHVRRSSRYAVLADIELRDAEGGSIALLSGLRLRAASLGDAASREPMIYRAAPALARHAAGASDRAPARPAGAAAIEALDAALAAAPEECEGRLLLESAAVRFAADRLARAEAASFGAAPSPIEATLRAALAETGGAEAAAALPEANILLQAALADAPDAAASAALLAHAAERTDDAAEAKDLIEQHLRANPAARWREEALLRAAEAAIDAWPNGRPLRIAVLDAPEARILGRLAQRCGAAARISAAGGDEGGAGALALTDPRIETLRRRTDGRAETPDEDVADIILSFGRAADALHAAAPAPGALFLGAAAASSTLTRLLGAAYPSLAEVDAAGGASLDADLRGARETWRVLRAADGADAGALVVAEAVHETFNGTSNEALGRPIGVADTTPDRPFRLAPGAARPAPGWAAALFAGAGADARDGAEPALEVIFIERRGAAAGAVSDVIAEAGAQLAARLAAGAPQILLALAPQEAEPETLGDGAEARAPRADPLLDALRGLARTAYNEHSEQWIGVAVAGSAETLRRETAALRAAWAAREPSLNADRPGESMRVVEAQPAPRAARPGMRRSLTLKRRGRLDGFLWRETPRRAPEPDEIEVAIKATGLNFRDAMWAMNLLTEEALEDGLSGPTLGFEAAGVVTRIGEAVAHLAPGDAVMLCGADLFTSHATLPASAAARTPTGFDPAQAASLPVAQMTAQYGLVSLARLQAGETVLIHGAAGAVGLAALRIAKRLGARAIVTAGTPEKRALLRALGADVAASSRDGGFVDAVRGETGGAGVDVVLNSLAGAAMEQSVALLKPFGR